MAGRATDRLSLVSSYVQTVTQWTIFSMTLPVGGRIT